MKQRWNLWRWFYFEKEKVGIFQAEREETEHINDDEDGREAHWRNSLR